MTDTVADIARYRLERAREALVEAEILLNSGHANTFVNRLYYAAFYAVSALLYLQNLQSSKHSGIRAFFHQHAVKPGIVSRELGALYDLLYMRRQTGDYDDLVHFDIDEVAPLLPETLAFVQAIEQLLQKELHMED
ncbi:MAG: HEPN domain-containing protein [Geobacteraceae bacterium]